MVLEKKLDGIQMTVISMFSTMVATRTLTKNGILSTVADIHDRRLRGKNTHNSRKVALTTTEPVLHIDSNNNEQNQLLGGRPSIHREKVEILTDESTVVLKTSKLHR